MLVVGLLWVVVCSGSVAVVSVGLLRGCGVVGCGVVGCVSFSVLCVRVGGCECVSGVECQGWCVQRLWERIGGVVCSGVGDESVRECRGGGVWERGRVGAGACESVGVFWLCACGVFAPAK